MKFFKLTLFSSLLLLSLFVFTGAMHPKIASSGESPGIEAEAVQGNEAEARHQRRAYRKALRENTTFSQRIALKVVQKKMDKQMGDNPAGGKSQLIALILAIFLGGLGIHRFYLGYTGIGIVQLFTAGGCGIWALIDIIRIATGDLQPRDGAYAETL